VLRYLVTGCAGFIGSSLTDRLLALNGKVIGVDIFRDYYDTSIKRKNLSDALRSPDFTLLEMDLAGDVSFLNHHISPDDDLVVFHLAAQAGVRKSWGSDFHIYTRDNVNATQNLLEWSQKRGKIRNFVYASSSSVYGIQKELPMEEDRTLPSPHSPYGVTKLAGENLVRLYTANTGLPSVSLRFFTVYGPRQRPDMAFYRFIQAALRNEPVGIFGTGEQTRDFTSIEDIVQGLILAEHSTDGLVMNLGGGNRVTLLHAIDTLSNIMGRTIRRNFTNCRKGDVPDTWASTERAAAILNWKPSVSLEEGLLKEYNWLISR